MEHILVSEICKMIGVECEVEDRKVFNICFWEKDLKKDTAYFTIKGESFDGHIFDKKNMLNKAAVIFTDTPFDGLPCIYVKDPKEALYVFAEKARMMYKDVHSVAITGSIGKTTTKNMIYSVLNAHEPTLRTRGTSNSSIESSYMVSRLEEYHKYIITEMGLRRPNQIFVRNSQIVKPDICVITNIGNSHIENFRDKHHILEEKYLITAGMADGGLLLVNGDDPLLWEFETPFEKQTFAIDNKNADYYAEDIVLENGSVSFRAVFKDGEMNVKLNVPGRQNIWNALCCIAIGKRYGIPAKFILEGLKNFQNEGVRQNVIEKEGYPLIIADCVNATPESMDTGFRMLYDMKPKDGGKKWLVLGHMMRLGRLSEKLHREVGIKLKEYGFENIVTYSGHASFIAEEAEKLGMNVHHFYTKEDTLLFLKNNVKSDDIVLFKGVTKFCDFDTLVDRFIAKETINPDTYIGAYKDENKLRNNAKASIVVDKNKFRILHGKNIHKKLQAASLSMVPSILVLLDRLNLSDVLEVKQEHLDQSKDCSRCGLKVGEKYTAEDLLYSCMLVSAADALMVLIDYTSLSKEAFLEEVNKMVSFLGAENSYFADPFGRPKKDNHTTAFDLALIAREALNNDKFREIAFATERTITELISGETKKLSTNNRLLYHEKTVTHLDYYCDKAKGIKTGSNRLADRCVMSCADLGDNEVIAVTLGSIDKEYNRVSYDDMIRLLTYPYEF